MTDRNDKDCAFIERAIENAIASVNPSPLAVAGALSAVMARLVGGQAPHNQQEQDKLFDQLIGGAKAGLVAHGHRKAENDDQRRAAAASWKHR